MSLDDHDFMEAAGGYIECECGWPTREQWEAGENPAAHVVAEALEEAAERADSIGHHWSGGPAHAFFGLASDYRAMVARLREGQQ